MYSDLNTFRINLYFNWISKSSTPYRGDSIDDAFTAAKSLDYSTYWRSLWILGGVCVLIQQNNRVIFIDNGERTKPYL